MGKIFDSPKRAQAATARLEVFSMNQQWLIEMTVGYSRHCPLLTVSHPCFVRAQECVSSSCLTWAGKVRVEANSTASRAQLSVLVSVQPCTFHESGARSRSVHVACNLDRGQRNPRGSDWWIQEAVM